MSWKKITTFAISILFSFTVSVAASLANVTFTAEEDTVVIEGRIACLIPDPSRIMIEAVVANRGLSGFSSRYALITQEGKVYEIEDSWQVMCALRRSPGEVKIEGKVAYNPSGRFPLLTFKSFK